MPGGCALSAHRAGKLIVKTDGQTKTEKDMYAKLFLVLTSLICLDKLFYVLRQGLPMEMLFNGVDGSSFTGMS
jgi:hypothetical protein